MMKSRVDSYLSKAKGSISAELQVKRKVNSLQLKHDLMSSLC